MLLWWQINRFYSAHVNYLSYKLLKVLITKIFDSYWSNNCHILEANIVFHAIKHYLTIIFSIIKMLSIIFLVKGGGPKYLKIKQPKLVQFFDTSLYLIKHWTIEFIYSAVISNFYWSIFGKFQIRRIINNWKRHSFFWDCKPVKQEYFYLEFQ